MPKAKQKLPKQEQDERPGKEHLMHPRPMIDDPNYRPSGKLEGKVALITGGDSGIGAAVGVAFAKEGADIVVVYLTEDEDAHNVKEIIEGNGRRCLLISGNACNEEFCKSVVNETIKEFGRLDILVNNCAEQYEISSPEEITAEQLNATFQTNIFTYFYLTKYSLPHMTDGSTVINSTSVTAYKGSAHLLDYSATKGAIVSFTRSLSQAVIDRGIRVNAVAPGPVWTPLIVSSFPAEEVELFGLNTPMKRAAEPCEIAPCYVFLASNDSSYMTGQVLHPNGGVVVNG